MRRAGFLLLLLAGLLQSAQASTVPLAGLRHDTWGETSGAPTGIEGLAQTPDGWLWMAAGGRLVRFDGVSFTPFVASNGGRLQHFVTSLMPDAAGRLYIGYALGGLSVVDGSRLEHLADAKILGTVFKLAVDRSGTLWIAANNGLHRLVDGRIERVDEAWDYPGRRAEYVHVDSYGRIWALTGTALYLLNAATRKFTHQGFAQSDAMILDSPDGRVWLFQHQDQSLTALPGPSVHAEPGARPQAVANAYQSLFDREGNFWSGNCGTGICRVPRSAFEERRQITTSDPRTERLSHPWQLSSIGVNSVLQDREGNIWVGTARGLDRFRDQTVHMVPGIDGTGGLFSALEGDDGKIWVQNEGVDGQGVLWRVEDGRGVEAAGSRGTQAIGRGIGSVLLGSALGIVRQTPRGAQRIPLPDNPKRVRSGRHVMYLSEDRTGLRVALQSEGIFVYRAGRWEPDQYDRRSPPMQRLEDAQGRVWEGFRDNLLRISDERGTRSFGSGDGIVVDSVYFIQTEPETLIGGPGGFQVLHRGRFARLTLEQTGESPLVNGLVVDESGGRWINTSSGLVHVVLSDWRRTMADPSVALRGRTFDQLDGYSGKAPILPRVDSAFRAMDGRIWVVTTSGVGWLDPRKLPRNPIAPTVELLHLKANDRAYGIGEIAAFAPGTSKLAIAYTAPMYTMPERLRFRYRLHGVDDKWQEVGTRREAIYTNLGPGSYRFEVMAFNEDGVAGKATLSSPIVIQPSFVQTAWFKLLLGVLGAVLLTLAYRLRMRQITRRLIDRSMAQLDERERIARSLHDSFLQNVQVLLLRVRGAATRLPAGDPTRSALEGVLEDGQRTLVQGRDEVRALRRELPEGVDVIAALREEADFIAASNKVHVAGKLETANNALAAEVFAIAREAMRNAVRHSGASRIEIALGETNQGIHLTVKDNGRGMRSDQNAEHPSGHFGLTGMRERAKRVGGQLRVDSSASGTTVELWIPASPLGWVKRIFTYAGQKTSPDLTTDTEPK